MGEGQPLPSAIVLTPHPTSIFPLDPANPPVGMAGTTKKYAFFDALPFGSACIGVSPRSNRAQQVVSVLGDHRVPRFLIRV